MKNKFISTLIFCLILLSSCASRKDVVYFQDEPLQEDSFDNKPQQIIYKPDDILTINVSAFDPQTVSAFNLPVVANDLSGGLQAQGNFQQQTYLIDYNGDIEFPVLGKVRISGLTRPEATDMLVKRIAEYAKDPIVNIRLVNFTITIIGEVNNPGTFTIIDERITLLEALGMAGDLTIFGDRKTIKLIREVDGVKKFAEIDLTSINSINSPAYYLQQNDVIYIEPNNARIRSSTYNQNNAVLISAIGTLTTIATVFLVNR
ncbi:MAG: polysaccharide biosynthesis/export family protein [Winogradskyella sp.]|uniref:polysaccharide biosynthesis/export family protein n=1 Tax=Winogradskyella sp. TaxID=1883156 RepID=UPI0025CDEAA6|nr:polysaccharide biosynthesis/export family protein [Winogradskyella sp.]NRB58899.1 polysaccharide biosynthesis/export family protein [Winogradskyella sp.]